MGSSAVPSETFRRRLSEAFVSLTRADNLVVLKVLPGHAQSIAVMIDNMNFTGVLGTIAGDDTMLLVTADTEAGKRVESWLTQA